MSKYTTELRWMCENYVENHRDELSDYDLNTVDGVIDASREYIFDFDYPIFDENYRGVIENKIIKHYYTREICAETVGRWKLFLNMRLNEIMPFYNKLYESELLEFNPFYDADYTKSGNKSNTGSGTETDQSSNSKSVMGEVRDIGNESATENGTFNKTRTENVDHDETDIGNNTENVDTTNNESKNINKTSTDSGSDSESGANVPKTDRWEYYNDTPQGSVGNLADLTYLTNAKHITEDATGSTDSKTTTYGKVNTVAGTEQTAGTGSKDTSGTYSKTRNLDVDTSEQEADTNSKQSNGTFSKTKNSSNNEIGNYSRNGSNSFSNSGQYIEHVVGKMPGVSYSKLLKEFRETLLNIDKEIIDELKDLFFGLW